MVPSPYSSDLYTEIYPMAGRLTVQFPVRYYMIETGSRITHLTTRWIQKRFPVIPFSGTNRQNPMFLPLFPFLGKARTVADMWLMRFRKTNLDTRLSAGLIIHTKITGFSIRYRQPRIIRCMGALIWHIPSRQRSMFYNLIQITK